ncbi:hypothetical protein R6Q59_006642 [Mikania micrantha]
MDIHVKERIRALIPGSNLMGGEGLRIPSGSRASGGTRVSDTSIVYNRGETFSINSFLSVVDSNKHAEALRNAPLAYPDLCVQLFEGATSNGFDSWGPSSTLPHPIEDVSEQNLNDFEDIECTQMDPPNKVLVRSRRAILKKK